MLFKIVEYGAYLAMFAPLIFLKEYFFPFVVPKTIFFRIVVDLVFIAYIILAVLNQKYRPKITPLTIALTAFIAVLFLTALVGVNFERSFWSVFERMVGLLTFLHLFAFYVVLASVFQERKYWERILSVSIFVAILISLYTLTFNDPIHQSGGTLGNSSFLASYIIFNIFFAAILLVWKRGLWRIPLGLALALFIFLLFFNPVVITKGAVSSFLIGAVLFAAGFLFFSQNKILKKLSPAFLILMILLGVFIVKNFHFKDRPFSLLEIPDRSRQIVWQMGFEAWQERFWLGWGWENFNVPFAKYYKSELPFTGDAWYDRVHNVVLDTGVAGGIIGLLSYLSIFGVAIFGLFKKLSSNVTRSDPVTVVVSLALITLLIVYFLQNIWVFDMISSYIMFFMTLALIGFLIYPKEKQEKMQAVSLSAFAGGLLIVLTIFALFYGNIQPARASRAILNGIVLLLEQSLPAFQKAFTLASMAQFEAPERFSFRMAAFASTQDQNPELLISGFQSAEQELKNAISKNPGDVRLLMFLGKHSNIFYQITKQNEKLSQALDVLTKAQGLSPGNQQIVWELAQTKVYLGEFQEALSLAEKAVDMEPRLLDSHLIVIQVAKIMGDEDLARQKIEEAIKINPAWEQELTKLIESANIQ